MKMRIIKLYKDIKKALELRQLYNELSLIDKITQENIHMIVDIKDRVSKVSGEDSDSNIVVADLENALSKYQYSLDNTNLINELDVNPKATDVIQYSFYSKKFLNNSKIYLKNEYLAQLINSQIHLSMLCRKYINEFIDSKKYDILKKLLILSESDFEEIGNMLKIYVIDNNYIEIQRM